MSNSAQQQVDQERVREMRLLMAEGGDKAVEHKFGEGSTQSAEFRLVQRQREAQARRAREQREKVAAEQQAKEHAKERRAASTKKDNVKEGQEKEPDKSKEQEQSTQGGPDAVQGTRSAEKSPEKAPEKAKVSQRDRMIAARQEEKVREPEQSLSL